MNDPMVLTLLDTAAALKTDARRDPGTPHQVTVKGITLTALYHGEGRWQLSLTQYSRHVRGDDLHYCLTGFAVPGDAADEFEITKGWHIRRYHWQELWSRPYQQPELWDSESAPDQASEPLLTVSDGHI